MSRCSIATNVEFSDTKLKIIYLQPTLSLTRIQAILSLSFLSNTFYIHLLLHDKLIQCTTLIFVTQCRPINREYRNPYKLLIYITCFILLKHPIYNSNDTSAIICYIYVYVFDHLRPRFPIFTVNQSVFWNK